MKRIGICFKCGKEKNVIMHHRIYDEEHKDDVVPCCRSCHVKIHLKRRKEGTCPFSVEEVRKKSDASSARRSRKLKMISSETVMTNVCLFEQVRVNLNTGDIYVWSYFGANNGKKIKYIDI